jgi:hypothetical protein
MEAVQLDGGGSGPFARRLKPLAGGLAVVDHEDVSNFIVESEGPHAALL